MDPENLDDQTPGGGDAPVGTDTPSGDQQPDDNGAAQPTEFEIDGQKVTAEQIREWQKAHRDYSSLQPEFTRKSQVLSKLQKDGVIDEQGNLVARKDNGEPSADPFANNPQAKEAVKVLKELGFITKQEADSLKQEIESVRGTYQSDVEQRQLQAVASNLAAKYDGKNGAPKFDIEAIKTAVSQNPQLMVYVQGENGEFLVDLEQTYKNVHGDFWGKLPEMKARVPRTERGTQTQGTTPAQTKRPQTEEDRRAAALNFFSKSSDE
jgi:hypothetical protein